MEERFNDIYNETYHTITRYVISKCDNLSNVEEIDADIYFVGSWTNKGDASNEIINFLKQLKTKKIAYFGTAGYGGNNTYYDTLFSRVKQYIDPSNTVLGSFYCQGKMPIQIKERYVKMITENPNDKNLEVSLKNFEDALTHPDEKDLENVKNWVNKLLK